MATFARLRRLLSAHLTGPRDGRFALADLVHRAAVPGVLMLACTRAVPASHGLAVVDDARDTTYLAQTAQRVVSLSPATTELVFALGAGDRLVGRTRWCDYPAEARAVPDVGDGLPPNLEVVLSTHPDLVLLYRSPTNSDAARRLRAEGISVLQISIDRLADVSRVARLLGPALGRGPAGDSLAAAFEASLDTLRHERALTPGPRPTVLLLAWQSPPIAIGAGSFQSEILALAGGENLFADLAVPSAEVNLEAVVSRDPAIILVGDSGAPGIASAPEWQAVRAVRERRFVRFGPPAFGRPSPRAPQVVRELRAALAAARP